MSAPAAQRQWTPIDRLAEKWVGELAELSPSFASYAGLPADQTRYEDLSPAGADEVAHRVRATLAELEPLVPIDATDELTKSELRRDLELELELHDSGWRFRDLNNIESPPQSIRDVYDLLPRDTVPDWEVIAARMSSVGTALDQYMQTLAVGIERGVTPARRQIDVVARQIEANIGAQGFFARFARDARTENGELPATLARTLETAAQSASAAYERLRGFLIEREFPAGTADDGVGRDFYALLSRRFVGTTVDLDETYEWGRDELARMSAEYEAIAAQIVPTGTVADAIAALDRSSAHTLEGTGSLRAWMQRLSDTAITELGATHFDIPDPLRALECMIAPTNTGIIYYTAPNDDFSRPGRMWWSVPPGVTTFNTWRETTTVYHEGVPGHHLQLGMSVYNRAQLNSWRRLACGSSGFWEGWALYAERLMDQLGYLTTPADRLGMLDGQRMRAARVVLDIGVHLGKPRLSGTGKWDAEYALDFLSQNVNMDPETVAFECNRYLGWPGQAPSYKIGQRVWERTRDDYLRAHPDASLRQFHSRALSLGSLSLDGLRSALLG